MNHSAPLFLLLLLCGCDAASKETDCSTIAVPSVIVTAVDHDAGVLPATVTWAADGHSPAPCESETAAGGVVCGYEVAGEIVLYVEVTGYDPVEKIVTVEADECHVLTEEVRVEMTPTATCDDEHLVPSIVVTVEGSTGEELSDVEVTYAPSGGDDSSPCRDNADGTWSCGSDEAGDWVVVATAGGHTTEVINVEVAYDGCHAVTEYVTATLEWLPD